jgi:hypothetical protein
MVEPTFEAIVRGYKAMEADPDLAAVIVEVEPETAIPALPAGTFPALPAVPTPEHRDGGTLPEAGCLRKLKAARRQADGLRVDRAVACITERWLALEVGTDWVDLWVRVGVDACDRATFERIDKEEPY